MKYYDATICENGHVISSYRSNESKFCPQCGTKTFSVCQKCNSTIQGSCYNDEFVIYEEYQKPYYCSNCGHPFPWTQKILDNAVELLSFDNEIDEFSKELIKTAISGLIVVTKGELTYRDIMIADESRKHYVPYSFDFAPYRNIVVVCEKDTIYNIVYDIASVLGCSIFSS